MHIKTKGRYTTQSEMKNPPISSYPFRSIAVKRSAKKKLVKITYFNILSTNNA